MSRQPEPQRGRPTKRSEAKRGHGRRTGASSRQVSKLPKGPLNLGGRLVPNPREVVRRSPGVVSMVEREREAAEWSEFMGVYITYRCRDKDEEVAVDNGMSSRGDVLQQLHRQRNPVSQPSGQEQSRLQVRKTIPGKDCFRVGPSSRCFCGHSLREHLPRSMRFWGAGDPPNVQKWIRSRGKLRCRCGQQQSSLFNDSSSATSPPSDSTSDANTTSEHKHSSTSSQSPSQSTQPDGASRPTRGRACLCPAFRFVPSSPEEVGAFWLPRRRNFDAASYQVKCKCKHPHTAHGVSKKRARCSGRQKDGGACRCVGFRSDFACVVCDKLWESHDTEVELEVERREAGRAVRKEYYPLQQAPAVQNLLYSQSRQNKLNSRK